MDKLFFKGQLIVENPEVGELLTQVKMTNLHNYYRETYRKEVDDPKYALLLNGEKLIQAAAPLRSMVFIEKESAEFKVTRLESKSKEYKYMQAHYNLRMD